MTTERTETAGLSGSLTITIGGEAKQLRCLTMDEADAWTANMGTVLAAMEAPDDQDAIVRLLRAGSKAALASLMAYDVDGVLGDEASVRSRITPPELRDALEVVTAAAVPYDADAARSVAAAYGAPARSLASTLTMVMDPRIAQLLEQALSTRGPSGAGASATTSSAGRGRRSSSSSAGRTATSSKRMNGANVETPPPMA